jgi:hypothetical protein
MHAPADEEASRRLRRLFIDVFSWTDKGVRTNNPESKHEHALAFLEYFANDSALDDHPLVGILRNAVLPELRRSRPPIGRHGRHGDLNASRDQTIAETVASIRQRFGLSQEQASSVVAEALKSLVREHRRALLRIKKRKGADEAWIDKYQERMVDNLVLSANRIEAIAKKYRA